MANMTKESRPDLRVAIAGLGAVGRKVAEALDRCVDGLALAAVSAQHPEKHRAWLAGLRSAPKILPIEALSEVADLVVECAPAKLVRSIVRKKSRREGVSGKGDLRRYDGPPTTVCWIALALSTTARTAHRQDALSRRQRGCEPAQTNAGAGCSGVRLRQEHPAVVKLGPFQVP